jgi:plasmid stability protein
MAKMIQIRNVPEEMHAELKARAAQAGMSLSDFLKRELSYILETKSLAQVFEELEPIRTDIDRAVLLEVLEEDKRDRR